MPAAPDRPIDLLVIRLSSFGDIVLAEPVVRALKSRYPRSHMSFAVLPEYAGLPALFTSVDSVLVYSKQDGSCGPLTGGSTFDIVIDLQANRHSRRLTAGLKAGMLLRYRRPRLGRFFTVYLPWLWKGAQPHTVETYFRTLEPLDIAYGGEVPKVVPDPQMLAQAAALAGGGGLVGICPGSSSEHKSWGVKRFARLVDLLAGSQRVMLVGSAHDGPAIDRVVESATTHDILRYAGTDIGQIAGLLALCKVTVTNDSGLMHLAAAVGSRPIAIFGPTSPLLGFAPAAEGAVVLSLGLACSPCSFHGNKPCRLDRPYCLEGITPEHVASVVNGIMEEP